MPTQDGEIATIEAAVTSVREVRGIDSLLAVEQGGRLTVSARVGLSPELRLNEVVQVIGRIRKRIKQVDDRVETVFVEPEVASGVVSTEAIVIRAMD